jgi:hypothetical protein
MFYLSYTTTILDYDSFFFDFMIKISMAYPIKKISMAYTETFCLIEDRAVGAESPGQAQHCQQHQLPRRPPWHQSLSNGSDSSVERQRQRQWSCGKSGGKSIPDHG